MIQLDFRSRIKSLTPTPSVVRNPTPTPPKNLRLLATPTPTPQPWSYDTCTQMALWSVLSSCKCIQEWCDLHKVLITIEAKLFIKDWMLEIFSVVCNNFTFNLPQVT